MNQSTTSQAEWLFDHAIPTWVKYKYHPASKKKKTNLIFSKKDASFFLKGIQELSQLFTDTRPTGKKKSLPSYFQHPKYRSSYLLYFFPLQSSRYSLLFQNHSLAIQAALSHAKKTNLLKIVDLGAGPGTGSISLLLHLMSIPQFFENPSFKIRFLWFDIQPEIMRDGLELIRRITDCFPILKNRIEVSCHNLPWWKAFTRWQQPSSLTLIGNLFNESWIPKKLSPTEVSIFWKNLFSKSNGGGTLFLEPATQYSSQFISNLRDQFFDAQILERSPSSIWGPCLHGGLCPLSQGRDWCHSSIPINIPGLWFKHFSQALSAQRHWAKFSYLWIASVHFPAPLPSPSIRRIVSEPIRQRQQSVILLCEPGKIKRWNIKHNSQQIFYRGNQVKIT